MGHNPKRVWVVWTPELYLNTLGAHTLQGGVRRFSALPSTYRVEAASVQRIVIIATPTRPPRRDRHGSWQPNGRCITCILGQVCAARISQTARPRRSSARATTAARRVHYVHSLQVWHKMATLRQPSTHVPACGSMTRNAAAARLFEIINAAPEYHEPFTNTPAAS